MSDHQTQDRSARSAAPEPTTAQLKQARAEAAAWYAKMHGKITHREVTQFFAWRDAALNDAAYSDLERLGRGVAAVADDPKIRAIGEDLRARRRRAASRAWLKARPAPWIASAAMLAAVLVGWVAIGQPFGQTYSTAVGERRVVVLADGSTIELNTDSAVRVRLTNARRAISLDRGQALFAVAHDTRRPFIVTAGDTRVRAVGTRFEVYRTPSAVRVTLSEGRVQVSQGKIPAPTLMTAGTRLDVTGKAPARPVAVDVAAATGWTDGRLTFQGAPLAQVVAEINRYSRQKVVLGPGVPADEPVTAIFNAGDTTAFVSGVSKALDLASAPRADGAIVLTRPVSPAAPAA